MALQAAGVRPIRAAISRHPNPFSTILISVSLSCLLQQYSLRFLGVVLSKHHSFSFGGRANAEESAAFLTS